MNYVDIALIVLLALTALWGLKRGFIRSLFSLLQYVLSIPIAAYVCSKYSQPIYENGIRKGLISFVNKKLEASDDLEKTLNSFNGLLSNLNSMVKSNINLKTASLEKISTFITDEILHPVIIVLINIVLFLAVLFVISLICSLLSKLFTSKRKGSFLDTTNKVCGLLFGAVKGVLVVFILSYVAKYVVEFLGTNDAFTKAVSTSTILTFVSNHNPLI